MSKVPDLGFIGLGIMGSAMAKNLLNAGYSVSVYNRSREKAMRIEGATICDTPAQIASNADIVLSCVRDGKVLRDLVCGDKGLLSGESPIRTTTIIDLSTIAPSEARVLYSELKENSISFLDAPVSGGDVGALNATLTIMVGGEEAEYRRVLPILEVLGKTIRHMGPSGSGQMTKAVNQVMVALSVAAMTEGLVLAEAADLNLEKTLEIVSSGAPGSWSLNNYAPPILKAARKPG